MYGSLAPFGSWLPTTPTNKNTPKPLNYQLYSYSAKVFATAIKFC